MKENTKKTLKYYLKASLKHKGLIFLIFFSVFFASIISVITPLLFKQFFDSLADLNPENLIKILINLAVLEVIAWLFWRIATFSSTYFQSKTIADLDNKSFQYLHKHSFSFFDNNFVGSLVKKVKWFSKAFEIICDQITWELTPLVVNTAFIIIVLFKRNFFVGLSVLIWITVFLFVNFLFSKYKLKYDIKKAEKETQTTGLLADTITNNKNIKLFTGYKREVKEFEKVIKELKNFRTFSWNLNNIFEAFQGFLMIFLEISILYLSISLWKKNILTIGDFVLIQFYFMNIFQRVWGFGRVLRRIYESLADAEEMTNILETPHEITDIFQAKELKVDRGEIEFKNVLFCYSKTRKVLENFNLKIKSKERIALIGPSGAGKTTVIKLLLRMHDIYKGNILIDEQNIAKITQESLRKNIGLVPQDPILFHRTLLENIRYGKPKSSIKEVIEASKKAYCHNFIKEFDDDYKTYVGERGIKLSGGERQRIAIARAILKNPSILILDEATSSLDSESERLIQKGIENLMENKTVIVIAHRLSTIKRMDRIIVIDEGRIIEEGNHNDLIKKGGKYQKLWEIQAGSFIE